MSKELRKCKATLLYNSELDLLIRAIRMSRDSMDKSDSVTYTGLEFKLGPKDKELIQKCLKNDEGSVFEFVQYWFELEMPRNVLVELSRHRIGISPLVKSTRYTLNELFEDDNLENYLYGDEEEAVNELNLSTLRRIKTNFKNYYEVGAVGNDQIKHCLPEAYMTSGVYSINARALNHLFRLRSKAKAFKPFRELVIEIFNQLPYHHRFIFEKSFTSLKVGTK